MSKYRLELKCAGKLLGRWEIGDEPLDLSLSQDNTECLYFRLGTNDRVQKESQHDVHNSQKSKKYASPIHQNVIPSEFDGADMDTFVPTNEVWLHQSPFLEEDSFSDQDDFTLPLPDHSFDSDPSSEQIANMDATLPRKKIFPKDEVSDFIESDKKNILTKDASLLKRTLPREIYLSEAFRKQLDEDIPAVSDDDALVSLDEFQMPSKDEHSIGEIPELSEDILDSSHLISSSLFSSLRQQRNSFDIGGDKIPKEQFHSNNYSDSLSQGLETIQDDVSIGGLKKSSYIEDSFEQDFDTIEQKFDWDDDFLENSPFDTEEEQETLIFSKPNALDSFEEEDSMDSVQFSKEVLFESRTNWGYIKKDEKIEGKKKEGEKKEGEKKEGKKKEGKKIEGEKIEGEKIENVKDEENSSYHDQFDHFDIELHTQERPKRPKRNTSEMFSSTKQAIQLNHSSNYSLLTEGPLPEPQGYIPMEVWEFENNTWRMIGELTRGKKTTLLGLTTSHHRNGRISISGISEVEVILVDEAGNETIYVPDMSEDIPAGMTILFRLEIDKICIRPSDDLD